MKASCNSDEKFSQVLVNNAMMSMSYNLYSAQSTAINFKIGSQSIYKPRQLFDVSSQLQHYCVTHVNPKVNSPFLSGLSCFLPLVNIISTEIERQKQSHKLLLYLYIKLLIA